MIKRKEKVMKKSWIAMNKDGSWTWWPKKPHLDKEGHWYIKHTLYESMTLPPIKRIEYSEKVNDYTKSLRPYKGEE